VGEDFVLFHYGSYESLPAAHGPNFTAATALVGRVKSRAVNVLALIHGRVFFPSTRKTT